MLGLVGFSDWLGRTGLQFVRLQDVGKKSLAVLGDRVAQVLSSPKSHHCSQTGHACDTQVIELLNKIAYERLLHRGQTAAQSLQRRPGNSIAPFWRCAECLQDSKVVWL